jgi:hypothetical protein
MGLLLVELVGCATFSPQMVDSKNIQLLFSDYLTDSPDILDGKAVFAAYLYGSPSSQQSMLKIWQSNIFISDANGANQQQITHGEVMDTHPHWTKDGNIVFYRDNTGWFLIDMNNGESKGMNRISDRIADLLIKKEMTSEEAKGIKWK